MSKAEILKRIVKKVAPKATYGTDPTNPWSMKANINEDRYLDKFLSTRGINPKFVTRNIKVAHSKSNEYLNWRRSHVTEETDKKDMVCFDIPLLIRVLEFTREDMSSDIQLHNMVERLINMRETYPLTMAEYDTITQKLVKENHIAIAMGNMLDDESGMVLNQIEELERGCDMIRSYIGKDYEKQLPAWVQAKITLATDYMSTVGNYLVSKNEKVNEETLEGEQLYELSKGTLNNFIKKSKETYKDVPNEKKGNRLRNVLKAASKSDAKVNEETFDESKMSAAMRLANALGREKAKSTASDKRAKEMMDKIKQDVKAKSEKPPIKEDMMKSARIIKSIYKKKNMKEEMYDHEKDDKGSQSYGKPPKVGKSKAEGEDKTQAAAILKGGTTLTGQGRDTIEIDPMMRTRPTNGASPETDRSKKSIG